MFCLSVIYDILPEMADEFESVAIKFAKEVRKREQDCVNYEIYRSQDQHDRFFLFVVFKNQRAFEEIHLHSEMLVTYRATVEPWVTSSYFTTWDKIF